MRDGERAREAEGCISTHTLGSGERWMGSEDTHGRRLCFSGPPEEPVTGGTPRGFLSADAAADRRLRGRRAADELPENTGQSLTGRMPTLSLEHA